MIEQEPLVTTTRMALSAVALMLAVSGCVAPGAAARGSAPTVTPSPRPTVTTTPEASPEPSPSRPVGARPGATPKPAPAAVSKPTAPAPRPDRPRPIQVGSVLQVQHRLADLGYYEGELDGIAGSQTEDAVWAFQQVSGLQADGVAGPRTRRALARPWATALRDAPRELRRLLAGRYDVKALQRRLAGLRYYGGAVDGEQGPATISAVMAFQKVAGLTSDGSVGPQTLWALRDPPTPHLRGGADHRIEVDLTRQVLYYVRQGRVERIMPVSSGNGATYRQKDGDLAVASTPVGDFVIERRISGVREADLGTLYDPMYFYGGFAIHGSNSVPGYPASHGCVRLSRADALWLFDRAPDGTPVHLYGGTYTFAV